MEDVKSDLIFLPLNELRLRDEEEVFVLPPSRLKVEPVVEKVDEKVENDEETEERILGDEGEYGEGRRCKESREDGIIEYKTDTAATSWRVARKRTTKTLPRTEKDRG